MFTWVIGKIKHLRGFKGVILLSIISFAINAITPYLNGILFNLLAYNTRYEIIINVAILVALFGIGNSIFTYVLIRVIAILKAETYILLLKLKVRNLYEIPYNILENVELSGLSQQIHSDIQIVSDFVLSNFTKFILNSILLFVSFYMMFELNQLLFILGLVLSLTYSLIVYLLKNPISKRLTDKKQNDVIFYQKYSSQLLLSEILYASSNSENSVSYLNSCFVPLNESIRKLVKIQSIYLSSDSVTSALYQAILFILGGVQIVNKNLSLGDFVTINMYFNIIINLVKYYIGFYNTFLDTKISYKRLENLENLKIPNQNSGIKIDHLDSICLRNFFFSYQSNNGIIDVINNLSTTFRKNTFHIIQGTNGSGKTTLLKILLGLYEGTSDNLEYNGEICSKVDTFYLRKHCIAYLPQSFFKPDMSPLEFLSLMSYDENINVTLLTEISKILKIPFENCQRLSGGELKKLYLNVALSKDSDFLILDEPTNDLDELSKHELINYLKMNPKKQGIIVSTHDKDLIDAADEVIYL